MIWMIGLRVKILKIRKLSLTLIAKKVIRKLYKLIYYKYRKYKIRIYPINVMSICFNNFNPKFNSLFCVDNVELYIKNSENTLTIETVVKDADKICLHYFNILYSNDKYLGEELPWDTDFKTGFKWFNNFYKDIQIIDLNNEADVKVPWELSRMQHIFTLGKAYIISQDEKYAKEFRKQIESWINKNLVEMSVNWTCTMEVAIRSVNWICGYFFFQNSSSMDDIFWIQFNKSLYLHGRFIYRNLENEGQHNGNHYLSDLCGLIWLGIYFGDFYIKDKEKNNNPHDWLKFGLSEFENEMKKEVNEDGTDYEASTSYHRLVTEIFLITTIFCGKNDIYFSKEYMKSLEKMCEFIMDITKPNGLAPIIGDADDGRLLILSNYGDWNRRDFRHLLALAGEYFNRDDFRYIGKKYKEDALWIMGNFKRIDNQPILSSKAYEKGGYYILRNERIYCIIRCGKLSCRGEGGHSHNDQLSIELNVDGQDFIIDPGSNVYTANYKMRNIFRSTNYHNTLSIDNIEQNCFYPYDLFYMREETFAKFIEFNENKFYGEHYGYVNKCGAVHERNVEIGDDNLVIEDSLKMKSGTKDRRLNLDECKINFMIDNGVDVIGNKNGIELIKNDKKIFMEFQGEYKIEDGYVSYE